MKTTVLRLSMAAFLFIAVSAVQGQVTFKYHAPGAEAVFLAGDFNSWSTTADKMTKSGDDFTITKQLSDGEHQYKFVINGKDWKQDPNNPRGVDDSNNGMNSVITVKSGKAEGGPSLAATVTTGTALSSGAGSASMRLKSPDVKALGNNKYQVTFRYRSAAAAKVFLAGSFNGWKAQEDEMKKSGDVFSLTRDFDGGEYQYKFVENGTAWKQDPLNPDAADDQNNGMNSVLKLGNAKMAPSNPK